MQEFQQLIQEIQVQIVKLQGRLQSGRVERKEVS